MGYGIDHVNLATSHDSMRLVGVLGENPDVLYKKVWLQDLHIQLFLLLMHCNFVQVCMQYSRLCESCCSLIRENSAFIVFQYNSFKKYFLHRMKSTDCTFTDVYFSWKVSPGASTHCVCTGTYFVHHLTVFSYLPMLS